MADACWWCGSVTGCFCNQMKAYYWHSDNAEIHWNWVKLQEPETIVTFIKTLTRINIRQKKEIAQYKKNETAFQQEIKELKREIKQK